MYLFGASAIVNLVKRGSLKPLGWGASLDLVVYGASTLSGRSTGCAAAWIPIRLGLSRGF